MNITRETVLEWLEENHRPRKWLQDQCQVSKQAVSNWLREKNPQAISAKAEGIIKNLMAADDAAKRSQAATPQNLVLEFTNKEFFEIEQAALTARKTIRQWAIETLNDAATLDEFIVYASQNKKILNSLNEGKTEYSKKPTDS